jgi:hypothetical protein
MISQHDVEKESLAQDFIKLIEMLPHSRAREGIIKQIGKIAENFDIEITLENKRKKQETEYVRRQPKRIAAPTHFVFSDDEDEDNTKLDPDYKSRR